MALRPPFPCPWCPHVTWTTPKDHWDHLQAHYAAETRETPDTEKGGIREVWELAELPGTFEEFQMRMVQKYGDIT